MSQNGNHDLTIDELARETGMTVRNIRAHQSRGLLPAPEVRARTGFYGDLHVARLKLISEMQADGFNLRAIERLLESAPDVGQELLNFKRALLAPFEHEEPEIIEAAEMLDRVGSEIDGKLARKAEKLGFVRPLGGGRLEVSSPTLMRAGIELGELGVSLETRLAILESLQRHAREVARSFVRVFIEGVWKPFERAGMPEEDWPKVREALDRLRPLASESLLAVFEPTMTQAVEKSFGDELDRRAKR